MPCSFVASYHADSLIVRSYALRRCVHLDLPVHADNAGLLWRNAAQCTHTGIL